MNSQNHFFEIDYTGVGANVSQIQVLAAVIREMVLEDEIPENLDDFVNLHCPISFSSWQELFSFCQEQKLMYGFRIISDLLSPITYFLYEDYRILDYSIYRSQALLQKKLVQLVSLDFSKIDRVDIVRFTDSLKGIYVSMRVELGSFIMNHFFNEYDSNFNFRPFVVNIDWLRNITGTAQLCAIFETDAQRKQFEKIYKVELLELTAQCRYMSFWICLLQFIYCPSLPKDIRFGFYKFAFCLLQNYYSVYVHHVLVENGKLDTSKKPRMRDARSNTTRIKVYFTFDDGKPLVARFDLPHKSMDCLHLNIEDFHHCSHQFDHYKFVLGSFDHDLLESLEQALFMFDYNGTSFLHAGPESDYLYLIRVSLERAVFGLSGVVYSNKVRQFYSQSVYHDPSLSDYLDSLELSEECKKYSTDCSDVIKKYIISKKIDPSGWTVSQLFEYAVKELWHF